MTHDELVAVDLALVREQALPYDLARKLRDQLADNAVRGVVRDKRVADLEREVVMAREAVAYLKRPELEREAEMSLIEWLSPDSEE